MKKIPFNVNAYTARLIGRENISNLEGAIIEIVKNSYDADANDSESPAHEVTLSPYYIGRYEVTQQLWEYVMNYEGTTPDGTILVAVGNGPWLGYQPSTTYGKGDTYPAYYVSYDDIVDYFLPRLNKITGRTFRLPTEAEWEYAARGGQKDEYTRTHTSMTPTTASTGTYYCYAGSNNPGEVAWYFCNESHPVGQKAPNALGLYDMSGNAQEWCNDWYYSGYSSSPQTNPQGPTGGSYKIRRGGAYNDAYSHYIRITYRGWAMPESRSSHTGFRLACSVE